VRTDPLSVNTLRELGLEELRAERHRLSEEVARLAWLRRLAAARCDLEVARLMGVVARPDELPQDVRDALALRSAPLAPGTLEQVFASVRGLAVAAAATQQRLDETTRELVDRYTEDPARCLPDPRP
jgi:hypothetical protein